MRVYKWNRLTVATNTPSAVSTGAVSAHFFCELIYSTIPLISEFNKKKMCLHNARTNCRQFTQLMSNDCPLTGPSRPQTNILLSSSLYLFLFQNFVYATFVIVIELFVPNISIFRDWLDCNLERNGLINVKCNKRKYSGYCNYTRWRNCSNY